VAFITPDLQRLGAARSDLRHFIWLLAMRTLLAAEFQAAHS